MYTGKTRMPSGAKMDIEGVIDFDGKSRVNLVVPQYARGNNYYTDYSSNPQGLVRHLENNKQRREIQNLMINYEGISRQELKDAGYDPEIVDSFYPVEEIES